MDNNKKIVIIPLILITIIGTIFLFTDSFTEIPILKNECAKLFDDAMKFNEKIEDQYLNYISERSGIDKNYLIEQMETYGNMKTLDDEYSHEFGIKIQSEGIYDEDSPLVKWDNAQKECLAKIDEWKEQSDYYNTFSVFTPLND